MWLGAAATIKVLPKVSPIVVFIIRNDLALVPAHFNQWFWRDFDSLKFEVFWAVLGVCGQNRPR